MVRQHYPVTSVEFVLFFLVFCWHFSDFAAPSLDRTFFLSGMEKLEILLVKEQWW